MSRVFISHSSHDAEMVERLVASLEREGIPCWIASRDIDLADDYTDALVEAIESADVLLLVHSESSLASEPCKDEVKLARDVAIPIVRLQIDGSHLTRGWRFLVSRSQGLDATGDEARWFPRLADELRRILRAGATTATSGSSQPVPRTTPPSSTPDQAPAAAGITPGPPLSFTMEECAALVAASGVILPPRHDDGGAAPDAFAGGWREGAAPRGPSTDRADAWWELGRALGERFGLRPDDDVRRAGDALAALQLARAARDR